MANAEDRREFRGAEDESGWEGHAEYRQWYGMLYHEWYCQEGKAKQTTREEPV